MHLIVCQHGLWGNPSHMKHIATIFQKQFAHEDVLILNSHVNKGFKTYDGIDVCGDRLAHWIEEQLRAHEGKITKISLIGYSLGGLIIRYAAGKLMEAGVFDTVSPINFITVASPHLGVRKPELGKIQKIFNSAIPWITSRVGLQLSLGDDFFQGQPLLLVLSDPELVFFNALKLFRRRCLYANVLNDRTVSYTTASIRESNPYRRRACEAVDKKYPSIVRLTDDGDGKEHQGEKIPKEILIRTGVAALLLPLVLVFVFGLSLISAAHRAISTRKTYHHHSWLENFLHKTEKSARLSVEEAKPTPERARRKIMDFMNQLEWERVDVKTKHWHSHAAIIVRAPRKNGSEDVPQHMADHFVY